jgi:hypothetical protein
LIDSIRTRTPPRRAPSTLLDTGPGCRKHPGLFVLVDPFHAPCAWAACAGRAASGRLFFDNSAQDPGACRHHGILQPAEVAQLAERDRAMVEATSSNLVFRSTSCVPAHSDSARDGVGGAGCAPLARCVQRDTRPWGRSRADTSEVGCSRLCSSAARAPACRAGCRGFDSRTRRQDKVSRSRIARAFKNLLFHAAADRQGFGREPAPLVRIARVSPSVMRMPHRQGTADMGRRWSLRKVPGSTPGRPVTVVG